MTPQELKASVISLALQGKLVHQNANEAIVELTGVKHKQTEDYEFDIPDNWRLAHLEVVTRAIPSKQYQILESEVCTSGQYPVISQSKAYSIGFSDCVQRVYRHTNPVIVFGDHTTEVKYVDFDFIVGADGVKIFEPIKDYVTTSFLFYVFSFYARNLSEVGGYSRHYKFIKNKPIPLPPLAEQKRIVAKIEELLPYIDRYEQAWSRLEDFNRRFPVDMQKSILQMAIQGKLVEQRPEEGTGEELYQQIQQEKQRLIKAGTIKKEKPLPEITEDEIPFDIPEGWKWVRIGALLHKLVDGTHRTPKYTESGIPFVSVRNMSNGKLSLADTKFISVEEHRELWQRCNPERNDILLSKVGTTGVPAKVDTDVEFSLFVSVALLKFNTTLLDIDFLMYSILAPDFQKQCKEHTRGVGNKNWVIQDIANTIMPLPPLAEQKRIVAKLEELLPLCERLK